MKRNNPQVAILIAAVIIICTGFMVYMLAAKANELSHKIAAKSVRDRTDSLITLLSEEDYEIYFLGSVPPELEGIGEHLVPLGTGIISEENMPVYWNPYTYTITDENGYVEEQHSPRDYAEHMLIVVNSDYPLDETSLEVLRNCSVENGVPLMFIGDEAANSFRSALLLGPRSYGVNGIMFFENRAPYDGPSIAEDSEEIRTRELTNLVLEHMADIIGIDYSDLGGEDSGN